VRVRAIYNIANSCYYYRVYLDNGAEMEALDMGADTDS